MNTNETKKRRHFRRTQLAICKLYVSANNVKWSEAKLEDLSAGGAKFYIENLGENVSEVYLKIDVVSGLTEFTFKTKASVVRKDGNNIYAVQFIEFNKLNQIMLDEIINANNRRFENI